MARKKIFSQTQIRSAVEKMAKDIVKTVKEPQADWALIGIQSRGVPLSQRLGRALRDLGAPDLPLGALDITFYRDDMGDQNLDPVVHDTHIPFDMAGKVLFLVDDVLYTGRTIRCALDEIMDFGRPARIYLVSLVDRGHRELPIQPDFTGETVNTSPSERVEVHLEEVDGEDAVWLTPARAKAAAGEAGA